MIEFLSDGRVCSERYPSNIFDNDTLGSNINKFSTTTVCTFCQPLALFLHFPNLWLSKTTCSEKMAWKSILLPVGCLRKNWCLISFPVASNRLHKSFSSMKRIYREVSRSLSLSTWRTMNKMCLQRTQCPFFGKSEHVHDWTVLISILKAFLNVRLLGTK